MDPTPKPSRTNHLTPSSAFPKGGSAAGRKSWPRARADQFFGSAFPRLCSPEVTSSVLGPPCRELAAPQGSNGSSCTVPSVMTVVLMPVSGTKWTD